MEYQTSATEKTSYRIFFGLLSTILIALACRYINFLWRRRRLYITSWNMPGPFAFPFLGNFYLFYRGLNELSRVCDNLLARYPDDIFRLWLGPRLVYCTLKPEYIEKVLCNKLERADWVNEIISNDFAGHGLLFSPFTTWKRHRKIISPSFGQTILNSYMDTFNDQAEILGDQLQKHVGEINFDLREKIFRFAVDITCDTLMGVTMDFQTTDSNFGKDLSRILEIIIKKICSVWYHIDIIWNLSPLYKELNYLQVNIRKSDYMCKIYDKINRRQKNCSHVNETQDAYKKKLPFLDWILETSHFTETEIKDEIDTFLAAGSDTTTITICCAMMTMGMHQDIQEKVYEEVMEICGPTREILPSDINKLKYTERVIKESMRLFPPAPFMIRKIDEDLNLGEHTLPAGSSSLFIIRKIHTNPKYWSNPYKFDPDRFLPENVAKRHPCAYIPFSYGSRNCIGSRFAMMAILTTFAILIRRFKFFTEYKTIEEIEVIPTIVLELKDGDKVRLELR